ncbi:MAG: hypothetical protein ACF8XB_04045 [Planctomycetota bacterium JB042]
MTVKLEQLSAPHPYEAGREFDYEGFRITVRPWRNRDFKQTLARIIAERNIDPNEIDEKLDRELSQEAASETILVGWSDVVDGDGEAVPYTPELGLQAFRGNEEFYDDLVVMSVALRRSRFKALERDSGNSDESSGTS